MKKLLIVPLFLISLLLQATNYYVKNIGSDGNTGLSDAQAWATIAKVNALSKTAGDSVFLNRGDIWAITGTTNYLSITNSGTSGHQITYGAYGTGDKPIITGVIAVTGWDTSGNWTNSTGNIWYMTVNHIGFTDQNPLGRLWLNGVEAPRAESVTVPTSLLPWTHNGSTLYVYSVGNPATYYSNIEETGIYYQSIFVSNADYITIQNLDIRGSYAAIEMRGADHCIIENCNIGKSSLSYGLRAQASLGSPITCGNNIVRNCTFDSGDRMMDIWYCYNTFEGLILKKGCSDWDIYNNILMDWGHGCFWIENVDAAYTMNNILFHNNDLSCSHSDYGRGFGTYGGLNQMTGIEIYNNYIHNISIQNQIASPNIKVYNNIIDTVRGLPYPRGTGNIAAGIDIYASGDLNSDPSNIQVYNNTIMNSVDPGIMIPYCHFEDIHDNIISNNIIYNCDSDGDYYDQTKHYQIYIDDNATVINQTFQNNLLYSNIGGTDLVYYGHSTTNDYPHTIAEFNAENGTASDVISSNIGGDPLFVSSTAFYLQSGSPAINAGVNVGLTTDYRGYRFVGLPDIGAYEYGASAGKKGISAGSGKAWGMGGVAYGY